MTTSYPAALDSFTNPTGTDELDDEIGTRTHSEFHADTNDAIEAIQAELGTDPKGAAASVKARIAATETVANAALPTATAATTYQPLDTDLTAIAALTSAADKVPYSTGAQTWALTDFTAAGRALVDDADASAQRTTLGLVIGTNVQAQDAELSAIAGLTSAADALPYFTGSGTAAVTTLTAAARTVLDDTTVGAMLTTMGGAPADSPTFTGIVTIPAGTAAAPALTWTGDTNTGLYSDTADTVQFSTGGTLRATINSTGLAVGSNAPSAQAHIYGAGQTTAALTDAGATGATLFLQSSDGAAGSGGAVLFGAGADRWAAIKGLYVDGTGNGLGSLAFSTRSGTGDTALTEGMRLNYLNNLGVGVDPGAVARLFAQGSATAVLVMVAKGAAAQSANLQEWQNSSGTTLASVLASGFGSFPAGVTAGTGSLTGTYVQNPASTNAYIYMNAGAVEVFNRTSASSNAFIIHGMAAQSGNLQDWRNSAGDILSKVNSDGTLVVNASTARLQFGHADQAQTTVGAAGGASALPATPTKYFKVKDSGGTEYVIPAYAAA